MKKKNKIDSLEDLQREKMMLRAQLKQQEDVLKGHYEHLSEQLSPALSIANFISGNRLFKAASNAGGGKDTGWIETALKFMTALTAGGFIFKRSKKNFFKTLLAYAMDQGIKYITEKDFDEHLEKLKQWLSKEDKEAEEDDAV